jgi:hypothetical protein
LSVFVPSSVVGVLGDDKEADNDKREARRNLEHRDQLPIIKGQCPNLTTGFDLEELGRLIWKILRRKSQKLNLQSLFDNCRPRVRKNANKIKSQPNIQSFNSIHLLTRVPP